MNCIELIQVFCGQKNAFASFGAQNQKLPALSLGRFGSKYIVVRYWFFLKDSSRKA
jgi:hypothetical protein